MRHPDLEHPKAHRRGFAAFAVWFSDWQGSPLFVALLTIFWAGWLLLNQLLLPLVGVAPWDGNTLLLNLVLSLLAAYASSLAVMGTKVLFDKLFERLGNIERALSNITVPPPDHAPTPPPRTTEWGPTPRMLVGTDVRHGQRGPRTATWAEPAGDTLPPPPSHE